MAFNSKTPPVKLTVTVDSYNSLIDFIVKIESENDGVVKEKATALKDKLLRYSIPVIGEDGEYSVEMRFFPKEAGTMIDILLYAVDGSITTTNYYQVLLDIRNKIKEERYNQE